MATIRIGWRELSRLSGYSDDNLRVQLRANDLWLGFLCLPNLEHISNGVQVKVGIMELTQLESLGVRFTIDYTDRELCPNHKTFNKPSRAELAEQALRELMGDLFDDYFGGAEATSTAQATN